MVLDGYFDQDKEESYMNVALDNAKIIHYLLNIEAVKASHDGDLESWVKILLEVIRVGSIYMKTEDIDKFNNTLSEIGRELGKESKRNEVASRLHFLEIGIRIAIKDVLKVAKEDPRFAVLKR